VADRLLFGSDAPNTSFTVAEALAGLDRLGLGPEQRAAVTGGTARRLLADIAV
jgi:predicted TIM-barrel fold metal-dependent hydrolase